MAVDSIIQGGRGDAAAKTIYDRLTESASDGLEIVVHRWLPAKPGQPRAAVQLVHGSVEHAMRYEHFARALVEAGFCVYANDHRGHGKTADLNGRKFYFSDESNGWDLAVEDLGLVARRMRADQGDLPTFIFGHSMGSFMVRHYLVNAAVPLSGAIICGTVKAIPPLKPVRQLLRLLAALGAKRRATPFFHKAIFGTLNKAIENAKTRADFITRDRAEIEKYLADPYCQGDITYDYAHHLIVGIIDADKRRIYEGTPRELPLLIISGGADPCAGKNAAGVEGVARAYRQAGTRDLTLRLVPGARHEIINELEKDQTIGFMIDWIKARILPT